MKKVFFSKFSGTGNDFILIDKKLNHDFALSNFDIVSHSARRTGIGADGLLIVDDSEKYDFDLEYYNSDGSTGMLCGNGARCAIYYAYQSGRLNGKSASFINNGIEYSGEVVGENIAKLKLQPPAKMKLNFKLKAFGQMISASYINTGSPYVVIYSKDILSDPDKLNSSFEDVNDLPLEIIGKEIRWLPEFQPEGTNVCIIDVNDEAIKMRSFEKGVEAETLSCGTGAVAVAIIVSIKNEIQSPIKVHTKSGDILTIDFEFNNKEFNNLFLTGKVEEIYKGQVLI